MRTSRIQPKTVISGQTNIGMTAALELVWPDHAGTSVTRQGIAGVKSCREPGKSSGQSRITFTPQLTGFPYGWITELIDRAVFARSPVGRTARMTRRYKHAKWLGCRFAALALISGLLVQPAPAQETTGATGAFGGGNANQQAYCRQLERQLAPDWQQSGASADLVPRIESQMARADQQYQRAQTAAEKSDCFDYFLFSKSWRDTAQCRALRQQSDDAQRSLADLDHQRKGASAAQDHASRQDALLTELSRNQCGPQFAAAAQRRTGAAGASVWNDGEGLVPSGVTQPAFSGGVPGSSFRTICVRTCDGYYFPISFATTQDKLQQDSQICQSRCGGPAKLYYYPNPGGEVQQAVGLDGTPYTALRNAFRYRKELVSSCGCSGMGTASITQAQSATPAAAQTGATGGTDGTAAPDALPVAEFGTMSVEPEPNGKTN